MPEAREFNVTDLKFECRLLGAPKLLLDGVELDVRYRKVIGLFAFLALEGLTSRARLAGLLWSEVTDEAARRNLRRELHRLKNDSPALNNQLEVSENNLGLRSGFQSDVDFFEQALEAGQVEQALGFYNGVLLEGLELEGASDFIDWLTQKRERLERSRRRAMLEYAELLETRGHWIQALEIHHALLEADPFQERTHRDLMRLHALLGERELALLQFEKCQTMLETELGLTPLPETLKLVASIRAIKTLEPKTQAQALIQPPFLTVPLVGRAVVWAQMQTAWLANKPVVLSGEPGVGKTRLLLEFATSKADFYQLTGRPGDSIAPFSTLTRSLQNLLEMTELVLLPKWVQTELSRLVPSLSLELPAPISSSEERLRFLNAVAEFILLALQDTPILLADDLQFFDSASLETTLYLAGKFAAALSDKRVMLSFRKGELSMDAQTMLEGFMLDVQAEKIELEPLAESHMLELVNALIGSAGTDLFGQHLHRATGGNPFFALETIKSLLESKFLQLTPEGVWIQDQTSNLPIPPSVREVVLRRVKMLGAATERLLEAASLTSDGFDLETLHGATALSDWEGLEALELALSMRVLEPFGEGYRFAHDLMRSSITDNLSLARKKLLHKKLATSLEKLEAAPARIANHLEQAGNKSQALEWRLKAARAAKDIYAHREALEQYNLALEDGASHQQAFSIRKARMELLRDQYMILEQYIELEQMAALADLLLDPVLQGEIAVQRSSLYFNTGKMPEALVQANLALDLVGENLGWKVTALFYAGLASMFLGRDHAAMLYLKRALEDAPTAHPAAIPALLTWLCHAEVSCGELQNAQKTFEAALIASRTQADPLKRADALSAGARVSEASHNRAQAIRQLMEANQIASELGNTNFRINYLANLVKVLATDGQLVLAQTMLEEWVQLCPNIDEPHLNLMYHYTLGHLEVARGQLGNALTSFEIAVRQADATLDNSQQRNTRVSLAKLLLSIGDDLTARNLIKFVQNISQTENNEIVLSFEHLLATADLITNQPALAKNRLEQALNKPSSPDQDLTEHQETTRCVLAAARVATKDFLGAFEMAQHIAFSPALQALALTAQFKALQGLSRDTSIVEHEATKLLETNLVPPLEKLELLKTLQHPEAQTLLLELAATLESNPELKARFLTF